MCYHFPCECIVVPILGEQRVSVTMATVVPRADRAISIKLFVRTSSVLAHLMSCPTLLHPSPLSTAPHSEYSRGCMPAQ